jgi:hypothetical protein
MTREQQHGTLKGSDCTTPSVSRRPKLNQREIQFAADAAWPHTDKANAGIRAEFKLPPNTAMK